jgi:hypothetical protein
VHHLAAEGQGPRPEREGDEHRRGRRNRGGRDRDGRERDRNRGDRPPRDEHSQAAASLAEQQRRIHELESRAEESREQEAQREQPYAPPAPPAAHEQPRAEAAQREEPPHIEEPRIDAQQLLSDSGLVMIETDRSKAPTAPAAEEPAQALGRPRRERPKPLSQDDELVQIETRK